MLQFTSVQGDHIAPIVGFLNLVDSLAKRSHCLLDAIALTDLSILTEQHHFLNRLEEGRVDLNLDLQKLLIANQLGRKGRSDIRVRPLQSLDERIGPDDF